jgi:hypothetical protein
MEFSEVPARVKVSPEKPEPATKLSLPQVPPVTMLFMEEAKTVRLTETVKAAG